MTKIKEEPMESVDVDDPNSTIQDGSLSYIDKVQFCNKIAKPMASKKLGKKIYKLIKKAQGQKKHFRNGLKIVQKELRLNQKGLVIFAGDVSPLEIMCHLPGVCEEKNVPYCYTPSRKDIGAAMGTARGCIMVMIKEHEDYKDLYEECKAEIKTLSAPF